eukprot:12466697-Ditylum_brightwellii.AAC.1
MANFIYPNNSNSKEQATSTSATQCGFVSQDVCNYNGMQSLYKRSHDTDDEEDVEDIEAVM